MLSRAIAGITGERSEIPPELTDNVAWLRTQTELPICIGFGISTPEHVKGLAPVADGLIVGSALVRRLVDAEKISRTELVQGIGKFVSELASGLEGV